MKYYNAVLQWSIEEVLKWSIEMKDWNEILKWSMKWRIEIKYYNEVIKWCNEMN